MAQCVVIDTAASGALRAVDDSPCVSLVALSPVEYSQMVASPLNLSAEDGALLSAAILTVWATAWGFRQLARVLWLDESTDG